MGIEICIKYRFIQQGDYIIKFQFCQELATSELSMDK